MGKGADGCGDVAGGLGSPSMEEVLAQDAIKAALDFKQDRIMVYTVTPGDIPDGWGLVPGFEHYPSAVGGTTARWSVLVPYLLENYPDDFQLIGSEGLAVQEDGSALHHSPGSQYLGVRTVYPFDHPRAGQATDGLLTAYNWTKGDGVQGKLKEQLDKAQQEYNVHHFQELVKIRALRALGNLEDRKYQTNMLRDDLPEDWSQQVANALLHMPPIVWNDQNGFKDIYGNTGGGQKTRLPGFTHSFAGSNIEKPVNEWNFNDGNEYVTTARLQAAAAWCGFLKDCDPPMVLLPNLVDKEESLRYVKDEQGQLTPATGKSQKPLNYPAVKAQEILQQRGLHVQTVGQGDYVIGQDPPVMGQYDAIQPGGTVILTLGPRADWKREYVDSMPEKEDLERRKINKIISKKQEGLVFARLKRANINHDEFYQKVADILGTEAPSGPYYRKDSWLRDQLKDFPQSQFQKLLGYLEE